MPGFSSDEAGTYGEDQWERVLSDGEEISTGEEDFPGVEGVEATPDSDESLPELEQLLKGIPAETQALIDGLFRGRFVGVEVIDRAKLS